MANGSVGGAGLVQKAYDRLLEFALRSEPLIRSVADKRPARQAFPGSTVVLQKYVDLAQATTALTETTDPDAVALSTPTSVTITLSEYGNAVLVTRALELFSLDNSSLWFKQHLRRNRNFRCWNYCFRYN
jgi:hypothetical protein